MFIRNKKWHCQERLKRDEASIFCCKNDLIKRKIKQSNIHVSNPPDMYYANRLDIIVEMLFGKVILN